MNENTEASSLIISADELARWLDLPTGVTVWNVETEIAAYGHEFRFVFHAETDIITDTEFQVWFRNKTRREEGK